MSRPGEDTVPARLTQREAVEAVFALKEARALAKRAVDAADVLTGLLRRHMLATGEDVHDRERGLSARLRPVQGQLSYDVRSMPEGLALELQSLGLLTVNGRALEALRASSQVIACDEAGRYAHRGEGTPQVIIETAP